MATYIVSFDLFKKSDYTALRKTLEEYPSALHFLSYCWFIKTEETSDELCNKLGRHIDKNDHLLVIEATSNASVIGSIPDSDLEKLGEILPK